jgi:hypothetical protein
VNHAGTGRFHVLVVPSCVLVVLGGTRQHFFRLYLRRTSAGPSRASAYLKPSLLLMYNPCIISSTAARRATESRVYQSFWPSTHQPHNADTTTPVAKWRSSDDGHAPPQIREVAWRSCAQHPLGRSICVGITIRVQVSCFQDLGYCWHTNIIWRGADVMFRGYTLASILASCTPRGTASALRCPQSSVRCSSQT